MTKEELIAIEDNIITQLENNITSIKILLIQIVETFAKLKDELQ